MTCCVSLTVAFIKGDTAFQVSSSKVSLGVIEASTERFRCPRSDAATHRGKETRARFSLTETKASTTGAILHQVQQESFWGWVVAAKDEPTETIRLDFFRAQISEHCIY